MGDRKSQPDHIVSYTLREASIATGMSEQFLKRQVNAGLLEAKLAGTRYLIGAIELREWFDQLPEAPSYFNSRRFR